MYSLRIPAIPLALALAFPSISTGAEESTKGEADTLPEVSVSAKKIAKKISSLRKTVRPLWVRAQLPCRICRSLSRWLMLSRRVKWGR